ncbi:helix-turn-helix transcriptional regulator [Altererythrobacter sp. B11]|uniref:response regulator transcription factor n=1 Tax=Altererythrobacter sp. B11 TaxID=2060312 RepID=UPI000DC727ED|nr:response regulator transcription factor [Altererythrobacter sp. B11]BBC72706.1 helix-turn-helix transcriptional regulator [Altererythrobacter sp. B11]
MSKAGSNGGDDRAGRDTAAPTLALIDPSEFRRACIAASLYSVGFGKIAEFASASAITAAAGYDIAILLADTPRESAQAHGERKWLLACSPRSRIVLLVDDPAAFIRQGRVGPGALRAVLPVSMEADLLGALLRAVHLGYEILPAAAEDLRQVECLGDAAGQAAALLWDHPSLARMTKRRREVLAALLAGRANREIAEHLRISESTVKTHVRYLMRILGVSSRTQLVLKLAFDGGHYPGIRGAQL